MLAVLLLAGCSETDNPVRTSLEVNTSTLVLSIGESATRAGSSNVSDAVITYTSSKPAVATVDNKGTVKALSEGETTITISVGETVKTYKVIVNKVVSAAAMKDVDKATPLTLVAAEDGKITVYFMNGITLTNDIKYTINGGTEQTISKNTEGSYDIVVSNGDVVQLYSTNTSLGGGGGVAAARGATRAVDNGAQHINIRPSMKTEIYGNVMSLLKGKDNLEDATEIEGKNALYGLFAGADKLVNSDDRELVLPATTLKEGCYDNMFSGCKGIEKAPELPAPTLEKNCYSGMFAGCSKLAVVKCLATDVSAEGCTDGWLADAGTEAETTPVIEVTTEAKDALEETIPATFTTNIAVTKITLEPTALKLMVGETATLKAAIEPENATNKELQWTSSNLRVATVSPDGIVTAIAAGTATIVVSTLDGSVKATCQLTVSEEPKEEEPENILVTNISLPESYTIGSGSGANFLSNSIRITPDNATDKTVTWASDNPDVVAVDDRGWISAPWDVTGVAHITATANDGSGVSATCTVTVKRNPTLYYMSKEIDTTAGSTFINPLTHIGDGIVSYSSSDTDVATVNATTGEVTISSNATVGQTVTITATAVDSENGEYYYGRWETSYTVTIVNPTSQGEREDYNEPGTW